MMKNPLTNPPIHLNRHTHRAGSVDDMGFLWDVDDILYALEEMPEVEPLSETQTSFSDDGGVVDLKSLTDKELEDYVQDTKRRLTLFKQGMARDRAPEWYEELYESISKTLDSIIERKPALMERYAAIVDNARKLERAKAAHLPHLEKIVADAEEEQRMRQPPTARELAEAVRMLREDNKRLK